MFVGAPLTTILVQNVSTSPRAVGIVCRQHLAFPRENVEYNLNNKAPLLTPNNRRRGTTGFSRGSKIDDKIIVFRSGHFIFWDGLSS